MNNELNISITCYRLSEIEEKLDTLKSMEVSAINNDKVTIKKYEHHLYKPREEQNEVISFLFYQSKKCLPIFI